MVLPLTDKQRRDLTRREVRSRAVFEGAIAGSLLTGATTLALLRAFGFLASLPVLPAAAVVGALGLALLILAFFDRP